MGHSYSLVMTGLKTFLLDAGKSQILVSIIRFFHFYCFLLCCVLSFYFAGIVAPRCIEYAILTALWVAADTYISVIVLKLLCVYPMHVAKKLFSFPQNVCTVLLTSQVFVVVKSENKNSSASLFLTQMVEAD